jgi:hypothetical protein
LADDLIGQCIVRAHARRSDDVQLFHNQIGENSPSLMIRVGGARGLPPRIGLLARRCDFDRAEDKLDRGSATDLGLQSHYGPKQAQTKPGGN